MTRSRKRNSRAAGTVDTGTVMNLRSDEKALEREYSSSRNGGKSNRNAGSKAGTGRAGAFLSTEVKYTVTPISVGLVTMPNGRTAASYQFADPFSPIDGLYGILHSAAVTSGIWSGGGLSTAETAWTNFWAEMPTQLYAVAAGKGLSITNFFSGTLGTSWDTYFDSLIGATALVRGLQALAGLYGYNTACNRVAGAILNNKASLETAIAQVESYPIPPGFREAIDMVTGVFLPDKSGIVPFFTFPGGGTVNTDLGNSANVATLIGNVQTLIANMRPVAADYANIIRVLAFLYGSPGPLGPKPIITGEQDYYQALTLGIAWAHTAGNAFNAPADLQTAAGIKVPIYGDPRTLNPIWLSLFRSTFYYNFTNVITANCAPRGVFSSLTAAVGTNIHNYNNTSGAYSVDTMSAAAARVLSPGGFSGATDFTYFWAPIADSEQTSATNQIGGDTRTPPGYRFYYIPTADIIDATSKMYQRWCMQGLKTVM
jgi:hypothetical protein